MYFQVTVAIEVEAGRKTKKIKEQYLVDAMSCTEAEKKIYEEFDGESNWEVTRVIQSNILKVLEPKKAK